MQGDIPDFVIGIPLKIAWFAAELNRAGRHVLDGRILDRGVVSAIRSDRFVTVRIVQFARSFLARQRAAGQHHGR